MTEPIRKFLLLFLDLLFIAFISFYACFWTIWLTVREMAEVAKSVVSEPERTEEEVSLQELIDSELALRVPTKNYSFTRDFLTAEREHSDATSPPSLSLLALNQQNLSLNNNSPSSEEWTTVEEIAKDIQNEDESNRDNNNPDQVEELEQEVVETQEEVVVENEEYTETTEKTDTTENIDTSHNISYGDGISDSDYGETETVETTVTEKKKKKKSNGEGDTNFTKMKKTKKSKKTEEKENHISVMTNGHHSSPERTPSPPPVVKENELSNVCVKNLKLNYVTEANKLVQTKPSEVPVPPAVSIRELKSSFSKFDQLSKKVLHVRSSDPAKASKTFSQGSDSQTSSTCKSCGKTVFAMEQVKAEKAVWHKNCFRCQTCNKQLTMDIYSSHEGTLYCKPHFKELFKPKAVIEDEEPVRRRKPEMIIRENQPLELPPDVVRASDKPDLGLDELSSLNVKSRFQVFEKQDNTDGEIEKSPTTVSVKRSSSILSKLAKFQKKGMDVGVTDDALSNGFICESSSSSEEDEDEDDEEDTGIIKCRRKAKERPMSFGKIDDVKKSWESQHDQATRREMMREQKKEELQALRSRMFMGKQVKMKELYEQAVAESEGKPAKSLENDIVRSEKAKVVREKFEKGEPVRSDDEEDNKGKKVEEDMSVFEEGISKKSRSIFLQMDAKAVKSQAVSNIVQPPRKETKTKMAREVYYSRQASEDVVKSSDVVEDATVETADISSKFKFFETYKPKEKERKAFRITPPREGQVKTESPEREVYRDPDVVRCDDKVDDEQTVKKSQTASRMLSMFRQMEEQKEVVPDGPKPKKCFTPPPDYKGSGSSEESEEDDGEEDEEEEEEDESEREDGVVKSSYKVKDEFLEQARNAARAKQLAAKFESWEPEKQSNNNAITMLDSEHASIDSTKSLRAKFESLKSEQPKEKSRPKVNRFVESPVAPPSLCALCDSKVYPLEKIETNGKIFHKQCFRCTYCNCILRMDSYTLNNSQLYCLPHFKQLFISKGNYDEGFGSNQHKRKWDTPAAN
ncbi:LIM domain and actin-binding protein 1 isoform X12 [Cimex lectularius]|uniref:LIM zinc-binding domain-containing protein n=1 Tax=Cimex lectularius TaxID=79782 RepID=A0A8I6SN96_CIMLE|nr:LIM domain and actin-binding protein 1 isoform X12 [Cimex lectularius]